MGDSLYIAIFFGADVKKLGEHTKVTGSTCISLLRLQTGSCDKVRRHSIPCDMDCPCHSNLDPTVSLERRGVGHYAVRMFYEAKAGKD